MFPAFPAHAQPAILRNWQEAHGHKATYPIFALLPGVNVYVNRVLDKNRDIAMTGGYDPEHKVTVAAYGSTGMYVSFLDGENLRDKSREVSEPQDWV